MPVKIFSFQNLEILCFSNYYCFVLYYKQFIYSILLQKFIYCTLLQKIYYCCLFRKLVSLWLEHHYDKKDCKSITKAQIFKTLGNKEFQEKNYILSIQLYTKCALYAPTNSYELSIAIANRSASLFYLNRYNVSN